MKGQGKERPRRSVCWFWKILHYDIQGVSPIRQQGA